MAIHLERLGWEVEVLAAKPRYQVTLDDALSAGLDAVTVHRTHSIEPRGWLGGPSLPSRPAPGSSPASPASVPPLPPTTVVPGEPGHGPGKWVRSLAAWLGVRLEIPDSRVGWVPVAAWVGSRLPRPDVVLTTIPWWSSALAASWIAGRFGAPLVIDYRDPWQVEDAPAEWPAWRRGLERSLENGCLRRSAALVATTPSIAADLAERFSGPIHVITNASDPERYVGVSPRAFDVPSLVYAGGLYSDRNLDPIFEGFARLERAGRITPQDLQLVYMGATSDSAVASAARHGASAFLVDEGARPMQHALAATLGAACNLSIVGASHVRQVPGKLFEHIGARRPLLCIAPEASEAAALLRPVPTAHCVAAGDAEGIDSALLEVSRRASASESAEIPAAFTAEETMAALDRALRATIAPGG